MSVGRSLILLAALIVVVFAVSWFTGIFPQQPVSIETPMRELPPLAQLSQSRTVKAIGTKGFAALVSFSGTGFEPKTARVKAGDTVRFFNGSLQPVILLLDGAPANIPPGEYVERTFTQLGSVAVTEKNVGASGTIIVQ